MENFMIQFEKTTDGLMSITSGKDTITANRCDMLSLYNYLHNCIFTIHGVDEKYTLSESGHHDGIFKHGCFFPLDSKTITRSHRD